MMQHQHPRSSIKLLLLLILHHLFLRNAATAQPSSDRLALLQFKAAIFQDTTGTLASWTGTTISDWEGVQCDPSTGRVTSLVLQAPTSDATAYMKGTLSPSLGKLTSLEALVITGMKHISGTIPESISNLPNLASLVIEDASLQGFLPQSFSRLSRLTSLSLAGNRLKGTIPPAIFSLPKLQLLGLARNSFTGHISTIFKAKTHLPLQSLDLSHNFISGSIPENLASTFRNLTFLDLSYNLLSGQLAASLFTLPNLQDLSLDHNQLSGRLPLSFTGLKSLARLSLSSNRLVGQIPVSISSLQKLWYFNISSNGFSGPLPAIASTGLPSLLSVDLSYNKLSIMNIPSWIKDRQLTDLRLAGCNLKGQIPIFTRPESLTSLDLSNNLFDSIPSSFFLANASTLENINLSRNRLKFDLSNLRLPEMVSALNLQNNQIAGQIPASISKLQQLERLDIGRNRVTGSMPSSLGLLSKLKWLDVSVNVLTGGIPSSLLNVKTVRHVNFRANRLCGEIPQGRPYNIFPASAYAHNLCLCGKPLPPCSLKK